MGWRCPRACDNKGDLIGHSRRVLLYYSWAVGHAMGVMAYHPTSTVRSPCNSMHYHARGTLVTYHSTRMMLPILSKVLWHATLMAGSTHMSWCHVLMVLWERLVHRMDCGSHSLMTWSHVSRTHHIMMLYRHIIEG